MRTKGPFKKGIDMKVDVVKELRCLSYGVLAKSAPAHEGIEKCHKGSYN